MNEITRIHIAKIPYDIEISAKHEVEKYFKELENYANDQELMQDIEIRISELLEQRGVSANGVITSEDVQAIKKQLGEPSDFRSDESTDKFEKNQDEAPRKRLYRDQEGRILGGVLSGLATYFNVDPIWVRLGFILLFFPSGGSLLLIYILLWLIIPSAKTAIEKIQMTGKNVNLDSIREYNETEAEHESRYQRADAARRVIAVLFGCMFLAMSVSTLMITVLAGLRISSAGDISPMLQLGSGWGMLSAFILSVISGLLLSLLFAVCSYASFARKFTKKIGISVASIIALGIVSFGSAAGIAMFNSGNQISDQFEKVSISTPNGFSNINSFELKTSGTTVNYIVSNSPKIILQTLNQNDKSKMSVIGSRAKLVFNDEDSANNWLNTKSTITVYGPKLDTINIDSGTLNYSANQQDLAVIIEGDNSVLNLEKGTYDKLSISADDASSVNAANVTVNDVVVDQKINSSVYLGHVKSLNITQPRTCPGEASTTTEVKGVLDEKISYNGMTVDVVDQVNECGSITIN